MARVILAVLIVAALAGMVWIVASGLRLAAREGHTKLREADMGSESLSRIAFVLLMALMLYVAVTGGST